MASVAGDVGDFEAHGGGGGLSECGASDGAGVSTRNAISVFVTAGRRKSAEAAEERLDEACPAVARLPPLRISFSTIPIQLSTSDLYGRSVSEGGWMAE